jgi:hypothetical protein
MPESNHHTRHQNGDGAEPGAEAGDETGAPDRLAGESPGMELDPQTEALVAAAEHARRTPSKPRPWRGPRSFLLLVAALAGIGGLAAYAVYFAKNLEHQRAQIRRKVLDEQRTKYLEQRGAFRAKGFRPAGEEAEPLTASEFDELQSLRHRFGLPPIPPEQAGTRPTTYPLTRPMTRPADEPEV